MKIKTIKKMNLPELIQYVWKNELYPTEIKNNGGRFRVKFGQDALVTIIDCRGVEGRVDVPMDTNFTVTVEEELTEGTEIQGATLFYYDEPSREVKPFRYADVTSPTLKHIIQPRYETVALAVFKGKQLIWTKEHGIPESGVLEVDVE